MSRILYECKTWFLASEVSSSLLEQPSRPIAVLLKDCETNASFTFSSQFGVDFVETVDVRAILISRGLCFAGPVAVCALLLIRAKAKRRKTSGSCACGSQIARRPV